jgi:hypothetical protein
VREGSDGEEGGNSHHRYRSNHQRVHPVVLHLEEEGEADDDQLWLTSYHRKVLKVRASLPVSKLPSD